MSKLDKFIWIREVVLNVEYDIGGIHRCRSEEDALEQAEEYLFADGVNEKDVSLLNEWLRSLSNGQRLLIATGERTYADILCARAPLGSEGVPVSKLLEMDHWL